FKQKTAYEMATCWSSDVCSSDLMVWGPITLHFPTVVEDVPIDLGVVRVSVVYIYSFLVSLMFMIFFALFFRFSQTGLVMRATAKIGRASCRERGEVSAVVVG